MKELENIFKESYNYIEEMLIEEYEKRKKSESYEVLDSLSQIVKYLKRYR